MKLKETSLGILLIKLLLTVIAPCCGELKLPMKLYQSLAFNTSTSHNILVSPSGLQTILIITLMGTEGVTNHQIAKLLDIDTEDEAKKRLADYMDFKNDVLLRTKSLAGKEHKRWLSAIFHDKSLVLTPEANENLKVFKLRKFEVEMEKKALVDDVVKKWLINDTHELQGEFTLPQNTKMFMMNSINFATRWKFKFDRSKTQPRDWKGDSGDAIKIPMMETTNEFRMLTNSTQCECSILELPLEAPNFSIFIFLPLATSPNLTKMELNLSENGLSNVIKEATDTKAQTVHVILPKITLSWFGKLKEPLERLGLENLFYSGSAEMNSIVMSSNASLGDIFQNLRFDLNDSTISAKFKVNLTENATAQDFIVDHPFMFALRDLKFNFTTFVGRVINPGNKEVPAGFELKKTERKSLLSHVSFTNRSSTKQSVANTPKPINLNLTHFLKGNFSEDYADKNEADVVIKNKTQLPLEPKKATSLLPSSTTTVKNSTNPKPAGEPWSKAFCKKMEETAYRITKINEKCGKVDQKYIVETCVHFLKSCMDQKLSSLSETKRTALLMAFNNSALNRLSHPNNNLTGKFWTDKATNVLSDEKLRSKRQITRRQNCNEHERYCKARVHLMDKCENAKVLQESFTKNCGKLDVEKYEKQENYQKKGFFGKLWDDVKSAFSKIG